jgi:hypothetical protein
LCATASKWLLPAFIHTGPLPLRVIASTSEQTHVFKSILSNSTQHRIREQSLYAGNNDLLIGNAVESSDAPQAANS